MNSQILSSDAAACGCGPCSVDLAETEWKTSIEDPFFVGKQCKWHRVINGKRGTISPDIGNSIFVQISRLAKAEFDSIKDAIGYVSSGAYVLDVQFTCHVRHLKKWAKAIGAKRK